MAGRHRQVGDTGVTEEEATAYMILHQCGWQIRRIAIACRRAPETVSGALERRARELRIAREMRSPYEVHPYDGMGQA